MSLQALIRRQEIATELARRFGGCEIIKQRAMWSPKQRAVLTSEKPYTVLSGGNGAGKTTLGGFWLACHFYGFNPVSGRAFVREKEKTVLCWAVANSNEKLKAVLFPSVMRWIRKDDIERITTTPDLVIYGKGGNRIAFKSQEQDADKFQSDEVDAVWCDEEMKKKPIWDEIGMRTFRRLGKVLMTMTPWEGTLWMHAWLLSPDECPQEDKAIFYMSMAENPYYDNPMGQKKLADARRKLERNPTMFAIRFEGRMIQLAGQAVFNHRRIDEQKGLHERHPAIGFLREDGKYQHTGDAEDPRSWLRISVAPKQDAKYVMGADSGTGSPIGDYHAAIVIDQDTGEQVALVHTRECDPSTFGRYLVLVARFYNSAFVVPEANRSGITVIEEMVKQGHGNIYRRKLPDRMMSAPLMKRLGFWTEEKSKQPAVDLMVDYFNTKLTIHDPIIFAEMYSYTFLKENREGTHKIGNSNPGGHDDTMTALFCACRGLQTMGWGSLADNDVILDDKPKERTIEDMLIEDSIGRALDPDEEAGMVGNLDTFDEGE